MARVDACIRSGNGSESPAAATASARVGSTRERVSQAAAAKFGITRDDWCQLELQEEVGELTQTHLRRPGQARTNGATPQQLGAAFRAEMAAVQRKWPVDARSE